jgi:hypothetical protein
LIRYLSHTEINRTLWDECISSSPHGLIYASCWYLDIVSPGWEALVEEDYSFVFPLTRRKKWGFDYLFQPYFTQQLGIFGRTSTVSEDRLNDFVKNIPDKFKLIEIQLNESNKIGSKAGFTMFPRITHHLDLSETHEKLKAGYSENTRRNIQKAIKNSLEITGEITFQDVISLFRQNRGSEIKNLTTKDYSVFEKLLAAAEERGILEIKSVLNSSGKLLAGAIFIRSYHSYIFLFSATNAEAKETGAMSTIIDSFIHDHNGENKYLDFEGSMDPNLARFYKSFGSKEVVYLQIRRNTLPHLLRRLK